MISISELHNYLVIRSWIEKVPELLKTAMDKARKGPATEAFKCGDYFEMIQAYLTDGKWDQTEKKYFRDAYIYLATLDSNISETDFVSRLTFDHDTTLELYELINDCTRGPPRSPNQPLPESRNC